jgi:hypothetical protein
MRDNKKNRSLPSWRRLPIFFFVVFVTPALVCGCGFKFGPSFEDATQSILKKTEILSIVLDPPEALPGDTVVASYLVADEFGVVQPEFQLWLLSSSTGGLNASNAIDDGALVDGDSNENQTVEAFDPNAVGFLPSHTFTVSEEAEYDFDVNQQASQLITAVTAYVALDPTDFNGSDAQKNILDLIEAGDASMALRTLVVTLNEERNQNPVIEEVTARIGENGTETSVTLIRHSAPDVAKARALAATNPYTYAICQSTAKSIPPVETCTEGRLFFKVTASDDGPQDDLRYQWISIGGDFQSRRDQDQRWVIPCYQALPENPPQEIDKEDPAGFDPRRDPNLYPVFLIVRDNGGEDQLGQVWAEFYVRISLDEDC